MESSKKPDLNQANIKQAFDSFIESNASENIDLLPEASSQPSPESQQHQDSLKAMREKEEKFANRSLFHIGSSMSND